MFKNKKLEVKLVDADNKSLPAGSSEEVVEVDYTQIVRETTETIATKVLIGIGLYLALDTLRQVIVKVTPEN